MSYISQAEMNQVKMIWFARWIAMCYADAFVKDERQEDGYLKELPYTKGGMSVLNMETGVWYVEQLSHFNKVVYRKWLKMARENDDLEVTVKMVREANKKNQAEIQARKEDAWKKKTAEQKLQDVKILVEMGIL